MSDVDVGNGTSDELGTIISNFQQHISDIEVSDSNEKKDCDAYSNFNNMGYFIQNIGPTGANLPNSYDNDYDLVYSND
ncbi:hypothetical protein H5410_051969 [Solanum commersonii]|uniref:Uncharacterized protein n=1 Tax=Solanum commersonii TaxID=4109 RepID=A0A9J5X2A6_SOLCO|nr:hypothetical protein H5410_051969 [Solanum commersonii]